MNFRHAEHGERTVRLAYCLNLHSAADVAALVAGLETITLPLRERLGCTRAFGVGPYLPAELVRGLDSGAGRRELERLSRFLADHALEAFTHNAFPYQSFHQESLKERVFTPTWRAPERLDFTLAVARTAARIARDTRCVPAGGHLSISTHTGLFAAHVRGERDLEECCIQLARAVDELAHIEEETGVRIVLALEPEPRANAQTAEELLRFLDRARTLGVELLVEERNRDAARALPVLARHLGHCLDACHAAVEGEAAPLRELTRAGVVLGKLQYSNALVVESPAANQAGVDALLALDEPRYLHQVTGHGRETLRATDLPDLRSELAGDARASWLGCDRWVCHFHVPVDLESAGEGLTTTRAYADALLQGVLADPSRWTTRDLHVEIETYTWDVLPGRVRGGGGLVDGLEREYRHVLGLLERAGWRPTG